MQRRRIIIVSAAVVITAMIVILLFFTIQKNGIQTAKEEAPDATLRIDPDTGEQTIDDPTLNGRSDDTSSITVLGLDDFIQKTSIRRTIIVFTREQIQAYGINNLNNKYDTMTIRPQDLVVNGDAASGTIRLGDTDSLVNFSLKGLQSGTYQVTITAPAGATGGTYVSPTQQFYGE